MLYKLKETGIKYSLAIVFNRIVPKRLFRYRRFDVFELPPVDQNGQLGHVSNFPRFTNTADEEQTASKLTGYFRDPENEFCKAAILSKNDDVVAAIWINENSFLESELGLRIDFLPGTSWLNSAYVQKDFRRQGLYRELLSFVTSERQNFLLAINPDNRRSMAAHLSLGAKPIARITAWRLFKYAGVSARTTSNHCQTSVVQKMTRDSIAHPTVVRIILT